MSISMKRGCIHLFRTKYAKHFMCRIQSSNLSSNAKVSLPAVDLGNELEIVHIDIDPVSRYWTIGENSAGDLHSMMCETADSGSPSVGTTSCLVYQNKPLENLEEISLQSVEDAYLNPI
ncbi:hypothetical protein CHS0354_001316 [Potamilus streckersoni]|uniref:Uncharacterized protein n=1 Tax=Potamilus streckersoni TaxID=2493646 RepID=A0AAE0VJ32_9BIVA|nr:hypothetical protein CHS0354_001316 [Potamilus streckersoni]